MAASNARVLFVCDAGPAVGGGHVMRCLTLAGALKARGCEPVVWASPEAAAVLDRFDRVGCERVAAPEAADVQAVVIDHFGLSAEDQKRIAAGRPALVIDDLADRALHADLVLDVGPQRRAEDYAGKVGAGTELLLGPAYALVRPEFADRRGAALLRRAKPSGGAARVLVSMGLTDVGGITGRLALRMQPRLGDSRVTFVMGSGSPSLETVRRLVEKDPRLELRLDVKDMAELVAEADLVVGAGGSSTWERAVLGAPTLLVVLTDNQAEAGLALERLGAVERVDARAPDFEAAFDRAFTGLLASPDRRARLSRISAGLCDGQGAGRVAEALVGRV